MWKLSGVALAMIGLLILFPLAAHIPNNSVWDEPIPVAPNATLVYSMREIGDHPDSHLGRPWEVTVDYPWLLWRGAHLVQSPLYPDQTEVRQAIEAYNFVTKRRTFLEQVHGIAWFADATVYYWRNDTLYGYELVTRKEFAVAHLDELDMRNFDQYKRTPAFNGTTLFWTDFYPEICQQPLPCDELYEYDCATELMAYDVAMQKKQSLGLQPLRAFVSWATAKKLVIYSPGPPTACTAKSFPGTSSVMDIETGNEMSAHLFALQSGMRFVSVFDDTVAYGFSLDKRAARVVNFAPGAEPQLRFSANDIAAIALAGQDLLLYTPLPNLIVTPVASHRGSLGVLDIETGWSQRLDEGNYIQSATGDGHYVAWTTYDGDLYAAPIELQLAAD